MANNPLSNLRNQIIEDSGTPTLLNRDYLVTGLGDDSVTVPENIDADLKAAFQSEQDGLEFFNEESEVGQIENNSFNVNKVTAKFLGKEYAEKLTFTFSLIGPESSQTLELKILNQPASWSWSDLSSIATGFPFDITAISGAEFTFESAKGPNQAFSAKLTPPKQFKPIVDILEGLNFPKIALPFKGIMDFSKVDGDKVLLPTTLIEAPFSGSGESYTLLFLTVKGPVFGLQIGPPELQSSDDPKDTEDPDDSFYDQYIGLYFGVNLQVEADNSRNVIYQVRAYAAFSPGGQEIDPGKSYPFYFTLGPSDEGEALLTPATVISVLADGQGSFFEGTPPQLQQFLAGVGLRGFSLSGVSKNSTPQLQNTFISIGSDPNVINDENPWVPFEDPTNGINFGITDFGLDWTIAKIDEKNEQSYLFQTSFILFPDLFQAANPDENGLFTIQFSSNMVFNASFDGVASLNQLISTLSAGLIAIPDSFIDVSVSNIKLTVDVSSKSYQFSTDFDVNVNLFTIGGNPALAISDGQLAFGAVTPVESSNPGNSPQTTYTAHISGFVGVGPLFANASLDYEQTGKNKTWDVSAHLAQSIDIETVVQQFLSFGDNYQFPDFLPGTLMITELGIDATIETGDTPKNTYTLIGGFEWKFNLGDAFSVDTQAKILLHYDSSKPTAQQYSGEVATLWDFSFLNDTVLLAYNFNPDNSGTNATMTMTWAGLTAVYSVDKKVLTFTLKNWSLGKLLQKLVQSLGNPYFTLESPWDILNQISLDGLSLVINLENSSGKTAPSIAATYTLPSPIDLGFIKINGINFFRKEVNEKQEINLAIDGSSVLTNTSQGSNEEEWNNLLDQKKGQPVNKMPNVPGRTNDYFSLPLLALGQRIGITGYQDFNSTKEVIDALAKIPSTTGDSNPVNPGASGAPKGTPYYDRNVGWLIAGHLQLLKAGNDWTVDLMLVFNDPNLYGLRLAAAGPKAKALAGMVLDILYKKITDDVGVYQIDWTFPDSIRNLNFGAVSVVLPSIGVKIYTNGDFFIDIGFPYNMDFSRSFSFSAIIYGIPVLGSGGLYFGKLSSVTATQTPKTTKGTFDPVIVFGLGMQLGLGYNFSMGPLKAGFALTAFGILEGVIATFLPYQSGFGGNTPVQNDYYFYIKGTVGVLGKLYGTLDFGIISASLLIKITISLSLVYESYKPIPITVRAKVDVSLKVKINLGLFKITISLSFHANVSAGFDIAAPDQGLAPWADAGGIAAKEITTLAARREMLAAFAAMDLAQVNLTLEGGDKPKLNLYVTPQYTIMADEGETDYAEQKGAFAFMLSMDAPSASGEQNDGDTSLDRLCKYYLLWLVAKLNITSTPNNTVDELENASISKEDLQAGFDMLADPANPPFGITDLLEFLSNFDMEITIPDEQNNSQVEEILNAGCMIFPVFDGLNITVPQAEDPTIDTNIPFESYATADQDYLAAVATLFQQLAAVINTEHEQPKAAKLDGSESVESLAAMVFVDAFLVIGRQLLQASIDAFDDYAYNLENGNSIEAILKWADEDRENLLDVADVVSPNGSFPLQSAATLTLPLKPYTLQQGATLDKVAAAYSDSDSSPRWSTSAEQLINENGESPVLAPGTEVSLTIDGEPKSVTISLGMTFNGLAKAFGIDLPELAQQESLYGMNGLLRQGMPLLLPALAYQTASGDTLAGVGAQFGLGVADIFPEDSELNQGVELFDASSDQIFALTGLTRLLEDDLWQALNTADQISQVSGMVSRFLLYGVRLPGNSDHTSGLNLSTDFLYPDNQESYGLYQLSGQQFPTPATIPEGSEYNITLTRDAESHGVDLSFITIDSGDSGSMKLTSAYGILSSILGYAQQGVFEPSPSFYLEPGAMRTANSLAVKSFSLWASSGISLLQGMCSDARATAQEEQPQVQPILWSLPDNLIRLINRRTGTLTPVLGDFNNTQPYMPAYAPTVVTTDSATHLTTETPVESYCYATRVDFTIKKLPLAVLQEAQSPSNLLSAQSYEVVAPSATEAQALEQLLTAISQAGTGLVSGLFLLMPQGNATATNLLSQAQDDFIAFLTQTNLSTETNPPPALAAALVEEGPQAPRGILNPVDEFIQLLWELSTVRSGGYYLSYQDLVSKTGLPDAIFDESGAAVLTLVIAYNNGATALQGRLANFVNAFFTTDTILQQNSTLSLQSASVGELESLPTGSNDTLKKLAAFYGIGIGILAELNREQALSENIVIPISGVVHLITPQEAAGANNDPDTILENLAAYYSVNAEPPITAQDIKDINPGVTPANGVALFIPTVNYQVSGQAAPGNTFTSLAAYYGLNVDTVAVIAANVSGIFPEKAVLNVDTQTFESRSTFGQGNAGFVIEREIVPFPDDPDTISQEYATAFMYNLYSSIAAGLDTSPMFELTNMTPPFGPQNPDDENHETTIEMRDPVKRRKRLAALEESTTQTYKNGLGLSRRATTNAALPAPAEGLPPASENPYIGVGSFAQLDMNWRDLFGNTTVTPFVAPPENYEGALNNQPVILRYSDQLIGLETWPQLKTNYTYGPGSNDQIELKINFTFDTNAYESGESSDPKAQAATDLGVYKTIYYQLNQSYKGLNLPWCDGNPVSVALTHTLTGGVDSPLSEEQWAPLCEYVNNAILYLQDFIDGKTPEAPEAQKMKIPVTIKDMADENIIPLSVILTLSRSPLLVAPSVAGLSNGLSVSSSILPIPDPVENNAEEAPSGYTLFAATFEAIFKIEGEWTTRVGAGAASPGDTPDGRTQTLWAVRFAQTKQSAGIFYDLKAAPGYFAPKPISRSLTSAIVEIYPEFDPNQNFPPAGAVKQKVEFTGIDQNIWFESVLKAVDDFLSPEQVPAAFLLDKLLGTEDPTKDGLLGRILEIKKSLAETISSTLLPVLSTGPQEGPAMEAAKEKLHQALLNQLSSAYDVTASVGFDTTVSSVDKDITLYGQPVVDDDNDSEAASSAKIDDALSNKNYSFTTGRIPFIKDDANSSLGFLFNSKNETERAYVTLKLTYKITHLEHDITTVPGIEGYVQSNWISLITGPIEVPLAGGGELNLPVLLRALPEPPTLQTQTALPASEDPQSVSELAEWDYNFGYIYNRAAQDSVDVTVEINRLQGDVTNAASNNGDLVSALAQFITVYPSVSQAMGIQLARLSGKNPNQENIEKASYAVLAFADLLEEVSSAYQAWAKPFLSDAAFVAPPPLTLDFTQALSPVTDGDQEIAQSDLFNIKLTNNEGSASATYDMGTQTISATINGTTITIPAPVVQIQPETYQAEPVALSPGNPVTIAYQYKKIEPKEESSYLSYEAAREEPARKIALEHLDLFAHQSLWSSLVVKRNLIVFPDDEIGKVHTNEAFLFSTPEVRFSDSISPEVVYTLFDLGRLTPKVQTLDGYLTTFFNLLGASSNNSTVQVTMEGNYGYSVSEIAKLARTQLPITLMLPQVTGIEETPSFVAPLSQAVDAWRIEQQVTIDGEATINFSLKIFTADDPKNPTESGNQPPLLTVGALVILASKVPPQKS